MIELERYEWVLRYFAASLLPRSCFTDGSRGLSKRFGESFPRYLLILNYELTSQVHLGSLGSDSKSYQFYHRTRFISSGHIGKVIQLEETVEQ